MDDPVITTEDGAATEALGAALAPVLRAGDRIWLRGPLGAGKTTFVRGVVRGLGHPDPREVASPTFAIHHRYEGGRLAVDHLDLYRLEDGDAAVRQGVLDPLERGDSVVLLEWPERLPSGLPAPEIEAAFACAGAAIRKIRLRLAPGSRSRFLAAAGAFPARSAPGPGSAGP